MTKCMGANDADPDAAIPNKSWQFPFPNRETNSICFPQFVAYIIAMRNKYYPFYSMELFSLKQMFKSQSA